jgi:hypothetical protein
MGVKVLMKRVPNPGAWSDMNQVLRGLRLLAMSHTGYISGETLLAATEQGTTKVISEWASQRRAVGSDRARGRTTPLRLPSDPQVCIRDQRAGLDVHGVWVR